VAALWGEIARRYRDEPTVLAYEVLNEPVTLFPAQRTGMNRFHHRCIAAIREQDPRHVIIINGDKHATDLRALDDETFADPQVMAAFHFYYGNPALREITDFPQELHGEMIDRDFVAYTGGLDVRANRERIHRPEFLDEFGTHYDREGSNINRKVIGGVIEWCETHNTHWNLWHWKDVHGMGILRMKEDAPWVQLLAKIGARELQSQGRDAVNAYMEQVGAFLPLEGKRRARLWAETRRDLEMQMLWTLVERMQDLTADELAALGASFTYDNFEIDKPMEAILRGIMGT
jgi:endoglucanase